VSPERAGQAPVELDVELEAVGDAADAEGLVGVGRARSQPHRARGDVEGVLVPVQDGHQRPGGTENRVCPAVAGQDDRAEPDLGLGPAPDLASQRPGQQLSSEADAQDRELGGERPAEQVLLRGQMAMRLNVSYSHGTAEHDQPSQAIEIGKPVPRVHAVNLEAEPAAGGLTGEQARTLELDVLDECPHGRDRGVEAD
jgi:hypothetical protein